MNRAILNIIIATFVYLSILASYYAYINYSTTIVCISYYDHTSHSIHNINIEIRDRDITISLEKYDAIYVSSSLYNYIEFNNSKIFASRINDNTIVLIALDDANIVINHHYKKYTFEYVMLVLIATFAYIATIVYNYDLYQESRESDAL